MTIDELLEKIEEATGVDCQADFDLDGQLILFTSLTENDDGELVPFEE